MNKVFKGYDMQWLAKHDLAQAREIFNKGSTSKERSCVQQPEKPLKSKNSSDGKDFIEGLLKLSGLRYEKEYKFLEKRKFRFDFAFLESGQTFCG